jgi:hypothetical protein
MSFDSRKLSQLSSSAQFWIPGLGPVGGQNGRINLTERPSAGGAPPSSQFAYPTAPDESVSDLMRGNWEVTPLSTAFFHPNNIRAIQSGIRQTVYEQSGDKQWVIDDQSVDELKIIMRAIFLQYSRNKESGIKEQIEQLNKLVIDWSAPRIMSEIQHYTYYLNDITHMPQQMSLPVSMSSAGTKSFPLGPFT